MSRRVFAFLAVLGLALLGYALFFMSDDEDKVREKIALLGESLSFQEKGQNPAFLLIRLNDTFSKIFAPTVHLAGLEVRQGPIDKKELAQIASALATRFETTSVSLGFVSVTLEGDLGATAEVDATLTATEFGGTLRRETRHVRFSFVKIDGDYKISSMTADPPEQ